MLSAGAGQRKERRILPVDAMQNALA